ncbi:MAG: response regulator [Chloroflexota bacterium]
MADAKQILVVDDHFEMLEFLRSMLELSNQDCEVRAVPSAEEGMLEIMRTKFDLVISDVRLPGMSGFDFIRRLRRTQQDTPVIMITAYSSDQGRKEASELNVLKYFEKPLDTDDVLTAVHMALHGEAPQQAAVSDSPTTQGISKNVIKRLDTLKTDTGSIQLMLATNEGDLLYSTGSHRLDLPPLAKIIARNINDSYALAERLGTKEPFTLQYHAGEQIELYCANIGETHFLTLFFDATARRGRIGTIWVFTQRAISDLQVMLTIETPVEAPIDDDLLTMLEPELPTIAEKTPEPVQAPPIFPPSEPEPLPTLQLDQIVASESELAALFASDSKEVDLDSFWDDASLDETPAPTTMTGMSIEEAREKGLLNLDFDEEDGA